MRYFTACGRETCAICLRCKKIQETVRGTLSGLWSTFDLNSPLLVDSPALIAASWIHASRLYEALAEKLAVQDLQAFCERDRPELAFWGFKPELACPSDVAHPSRATRSRILVLGFANLLGEVRPSEEVEAHLEEFADCA